MNELKKLQAEDIVEEFKNFFRPNTYKLKLGGSGFSRYNSLKIVILVNLGYSENWAHKNPNAYVYDISVEELVGIPDKEFHDIYRYFLKRQYMSM